GGRQGDVVDLLVLQPVGDVFQLHAEELQNGVEDKASGVEELEDEADGDAADQVGEEHTGFVDALALDLKNHQGGEEQGQHQLDHRAAHVVDADDQGAEDVVALEHLDVVLDADEGALGQVV